MKHYRKLLRYLRPHWALLVWATVCMVASSLLKGVSLGMLVPLVDFILLNRALTVPEWVPGPVHAWANHFQSLPMDLRLHWLAGTVLILSLLKAVVFFYQSYLTDNVALLFLRDMRNALYTHYQRLSQDFFSGERTGDLVSRMTTDVSIIQNTLSEGLTNLIYQSAQVVVFGAIIFSIHWKMALGVLLLMPTIGYPIVQIGKALRKLGMTAQQRMGDLNSHLIETLQGIRIIKAFTAERKVQTRFALINQEYYKANIKTVKRREILASIIELMGMVGGLLVLEVGGRAVLHGEISPGTVIFFLAALLSLYEPIKKLSRLHSVNQQAIVAARRLVEILETEPSVKEAPHAVEAQPFSKSIEYRQVGFRYGKSNVAQERQILRGINLTVPAGEMVAIVGSSGAGKTTLVNLLLRFYDPTEGQILMDGIDTKTVSLHSLRGQIGLVTQDPFLFHDSIRANIAFGKPDASLDEIVKAARAANADEFIRGLPRGYDTAVGDLGSKLSGGERQRIAIARAILKNPPILILDEATSQLDSESERLVQQALERLLKGRTALVIAHRFSTIRAADRILVLDQGTIADSGTHDQLLLRSSLYKKLYELQVAFE